MLMFSKIAIQKRSKLGYYWRFSFFLFLQKNPRAVFVLHNTGMPIKFLFLSFLSILRTELNLDTFIQRWYFSSGSFIKTDEWYIGWQRVTTNNKEWQRVVKRVTTNDNEWPWLVIWANFSFFLEQDINLPLGTLKKTL